MALGSQGLNNLGELGYWLFLVVGGSGIMGFLERRVGAQLWGEKPG